MPEPSRAPLLAGLNAEQQMRRLTRRSFVTGAAAALVGLGAWRWLTTATAEDGIPWPLCRFLRFNENLAEGLGSPRGLAPTFSAASVRGLPRTNGLIGLADEPDRAGWHLHIQHEGRAAEQTIRLGEIQELPRFGQVTELKCVDGWSELMHFGGVTPGFNTRGDGK